MPVITRRNKKKKFEPSESRTTSKNVHRPQRKLKLANGSNEQRDENEHIFTTII